MSRAKVASVIALLVIAAGCGAFFWWKWNGHRDDFKLAGVVETQEVRLGSKIGGRVAELLTYEGEVTKPGQVLVRLAIPELLAQRDQARARVASVQAARDRAYKGYLPEEIAATQGAFDAAKAKYDRLVAGWRPQEKRQAQAELDEAEAEFVMASQEHDRIKQLLYSSPGATSQREVDNARMLKDRAQARVTAGQAKVDMVVREGTRKEDIAEAAGEMARAKAQLNLYQRGIRDEDKAAADAELESAKARLAEMEANVAEAEVKAPGVARVEVVAIRPGDLVTPNQPILRILRSDDTWVKVFVPETQLGRIHVGQKAWVTSDTFPDRRYAGKVIHVESISEFLPRNVQSLDERRNQMFGVKVALTDPEGMKVFKPGMAAQVVME
jgi:HlyD family secretion protein